MDLPTARRDGFTGRRPSRAARPRSMVRAVAPLSVWGTLLALAVLPSGQARADGFVPRGTVHLFRCREDTLVTTKLTFDANRSDIMVNVADSTFTLSGVVRARWEGGFNDGLEWYFSDSDTLSATANQILFHGFLLPGRLGGAFFPPDEGAPTEANPQVWEPAAEVLTDGYTWSWTGRWPQDGYADVHTLDFEATQETIDVPYRAGASTWRLALRPPPAGARFQTPDGVWLDGMGRVISGQDAGQCLPPDPDPSEPRWTMAVNSGRHRWCILVRDAFVELVTVTDEGGSPVVATSSRSFSDLKRSFGAPQARPPN